eukprot:SAG11_NODE_21643_length_421_cov_0.807453_2_plen_67_part_01
MSVADWKGAKWIGGAMGQYRKEISASKGSVQRATVYVVGLGYYKLHVNGARPMLARNACSQRTLAMQ